MKMKDEVTQFSPSIPLRTFPSDRVMPLQSTRRFHVRLFVDGEVYVYALGGSPAALQRFLNGDLL